MSTFPLHKERIYSIFPFMKEIFKQIITDFQDTQLPQVSKRNITIPDMPKNVRKAYVFIGMRRSGKTWTLYQQMQEKLANGINKKQILYINFEDDRLFNTQLSDLEELRQAYFELYPEYVNSSDVSFFLDEIHEINGWEKFVRRLLDTESIDIYLTGSSAKMLSKEIATSMRGRSLTFEIFPFSFDEYLQHNKLKLAENPTSKEKAIIIQQQDKFLTYGGFPEVINMQNNLRTETIQNYIDTVIYRDIIERHDIKNISTLKAFLTQCIKNSANMLSINKSYKRLKSLGYVISKNTLYGFMDYFNDAYCLFSIPIYSFSHSKSTLRPKKVYVTDQGLITAYTVKHAYEYSIQLETAVFIALRRHYDRIYYYNTKSGKEINFIALDSQGQQFLVQVSLSLQNKSTRQREISALIEAMDELSIDTSVIITLNEKEKITTQNKQINIIPFYAISTMLLPNHKS